MKRCSKHWFDEAVAICRDCGEPICTDCRVPVRRVGTFCVECALVRSGVRARSRRVA